MLQIKSDLYYIGASEGRHPLFENIYPVPNGMSYNSYLITDEKTVLTDTCDTTVRDKFLYNLKYALGDRGLDYIFVHHMEPDHCALLQEVMILHPSAQIVCTNQTQKMIAQFFHQDISDRSILVKDGDTLTTGKHTFSFHTAPMVHWPEVMVSYDQTDKVLFSADAFGSFGELNGSLYADEQNLECDWLPEARRYYTNIVGKYGPQVQNLLKKASTLDIQMICPLHGPIWRQDLGWLLDKYNKWSSYTPEEDGVLIVYGSIYGHTEDVARQLASKLGENNIKVALYDSSKTHPSYLVAESFRYSKIVVASITYNNGIFPPIETTLLDFKAHNLQNRKVALIQNGSWAPASGKLMKQLLEEMKDMNLYPEIITLTSRIKPEQNRELNTLKDWLTS